MNTELIDSQLYHIRSVLSADTVERCGIADLDRAEYQFTSLDPDQRRRVLVPTTTWLQSALAETGAVVGEFVRTLRPEFTRMLAVVWHDTTGFSTRRHRDAPGDRAVAQLYIRTARSAGTRFYLTNGAEYVFEYVPNTGYLHVNSGLEHEFAGRVTPADERISIYAYFIRPDEFRLVESVYEAYGSAVYDRTD